MMRQARLALLQAGLLDQVETALASIPDEVQRKAAQIEWEYATTVDRGSPWGGGALDRVRVTTTGGTDTFDAGTINIMYEG